MATREDLKSFKDVSKLGKVKLKNICKDLGIEIDKSFGKKALINVVCNMLGISTSSKSCEKNEVKDISSSKLPSIVYLQKLKDWSKCLSNVPQLLD